MKLRLNKIKSLLATGLLLISQFASFAQQSKIDSLNALLKTDKEDTNKVLHLYWLARSYMDMNSYQTALTNGKLALELAKQLDWKKGEAMAYHSIASSNYYKGDYSEMITNSFASLKLKEQIGDKQGMADSYTAIGIAYYRQANFDETVNYYTKALKIYEQMGNKQRMALSYNNIGTLYFDQEKYDEALGKYLESLKLDKEINDKDGEGQAYNNLGNIYSIKRDFEQALRYYNASLKIREETQNKEGIASSLANIGDVYMNSNRYKQGKETLLKAVDIAREIGAKMILRSAYISLSHLDSLMGDVNGSFENYKLYILYRDSIDNEETRRKTIQSQMTFDFEKKEAIADAEHKTELKKQQELADEKSARQTLMIVFAVCGLVLVLIFAIFVARSLNLTRKQKALIEQQKLEGEEREKQIIDSIRYAKRIQESLLPTEKYIQRNFERLRKK